MHMDMDMDMDMDMHMHMHIHHAHAHAHVHAYDPHPDPQKQNSLLERCGEFQQMGWRGGYEQASLRGRPWGDGVFSLMVGVSRVMRVCVSCR